MNSNQLALLQPGTEIYFRSYKGKFLKMHESAAIISVSEIPDLIVKKDSFDMFFEATPEIESITKDYFDLTEPYFRSPYGPKNPEEAEILLSYWKKLCCYSEDKSSVEYIEAQERLNNRVKLIQDVLQSLEETHVGGIPFFANNVPEINIKRFLEQFVF